MELVKPQWEIWEQEPGIQGIYKAIERAGRVCYKSEDKITEDSAKPFVDKMVNAGHHAMLEHGTVYLDIPYEHSAIHIGLGEISKYYNNPYSKVTLEPEPEIGHITTNYRVLVENGWLDDLKYLCEPTEYHEKRITVHFICDRGVSHEFVRHRVMSFAQESTRYCNYSKDKFGNEVTFIDPCWTLAPIVPEDFRGEHFLDALENAEKEYLYLIENGWKPQQARAVLPNALKTELVVTGFVSDWWGKYLVFDKASGKLIKVIPGYNYSEVEAVDTQRYRVVEQGFFPLRCGKGAHPQARELAIPLREEFIKRELIK